MLSHLRAIWTDESGQDLAEYALLLALIAIVVIVAVSALGPIIAQVFTDIATSLQDGV
ncbi:MAG: Flp family type IVb pilin [Gemmatimonadota bacterium]